jgi:hypothetical protein
LGSASSGGQVGSAFAHQVLHIALGGAWRAAEGEVDVDEILGQVLQRAEVGQFFLCACAEEKHQLATLELARLPQRRRHSVIARIGALPVPVQIITMWLFGWLGIRKLVPKGPMTCTLSPTCRSHM